jgi:hypothetical protein
MNGDQITVLGAILILAEARIPLGIRALFFVPALAEATGSVPEIDGR